LTVDTTRISVLVAQFPVSLDIGENLETILSTLRWAQRGDLVVFPEGAVSGYAEDPAFLQTIDTPILTAALATLWNEAALRQIHLVVGSCVHDAGRWYNSAVYCGPEREQAVYRKVNLATHERGHFTAGANLPVIKIVAGNRSVGLAIQLCREIRFPEQWRYLARSGAEVFAYLTNAVGDDSGSLAPVWRSHLISRAAENQRFVLSANNAAGGQKCPSMIVAPDGRVLWEVLADSIAVERCEIDLAEVSDWYLSQSRDDLLQG
jgi:predicted amidohydrolase